MNTQIPLDHIGIMEFGEKMFLIEFIRMVVMSLKLLSKKELF